MVNFVLSIFFICQVCVEVMIHKNWNTHTCTTLPMRLLKNTKMYKVSLHFLAIQAVQWYSYCIFWHLTCTVYYKKEKYIHVNI